MRKLLAHILSFVFNPIVLIFCVPPFLVYRYTLDLYAAFFWGFYTLFFLIAIAVVMIQAVSNGTFTDLDVSKREQRPLFFLLCIVISVVYLGGLVYLHAPLSLFLMTISVMIGIVIASIINLFIKASLHIATLTALVVALIFFYQGATYWLLLLIPLVSWARITINRHTLQETIIGAIFGTVLSLILSWSMVTVFNQAYVF